VLIWVDRRRLADPKFLIALFFPACPLSLTPRPWHDISGDGVTLLNKGKPPLHGIARNSLGKYGRLHFPSNKPRIIIIIKIKNPEKITDTVKGKKEKTKKKNITYKLQYMSLQDSLRT
jgi:hypothetical protein